MFKLEVVRSGSLRLILVLLSLIFLYILNGCGNRNSSPALIVSYSSKKPDQLKNQRVVSVELLKTLQKTLSERDSVRASGCFLFPILQSGVEVFTTNEVLEKEWTINGKKVTRELFLKYFQDMRSIFLLDDLSGVFDKVNLDSLLIKDTLVYSTYGLTEPCYSLYSVVISGDEIAFRVDSYSNEKYVGGRSSDQDIPENSSEYCEHNTWWRFKLKGNKLSVLSIGLAG
jgi:hypothetical protein